MYEAKLVSTGKRKERDRAGEIIAREWAANPDLPPLTRSEANEMAKAEARIEHEICSRALRRLEASLVFTGPIKRS